MQNIFLKLSTNENVNILSEKHKLASQHNKKLSRRGTIPLTHNTTK